MTGSKKASEKSDTEYRCLRCGKKFAEPITLFYQEYAGASHQAEFISPCCRARYEELDETVRS